MKKNTNLHAAKAAKNDEFYTQLYDIENELRHYWEQLRGKTILCNCDDPETSNFWQCLHMQFGHRGIKRLMATHFVYENLFSPGETYLLDYTGGADTDFKAGTRTPLQGNGDFRSPECIEFLKQADLVITNPPFSLFREYVAQLVEYDKKFLIIGNLNALTYCEIFPLIRDNKMWLGYSPRGMYFNNPEGKLIATNAVWFTNLEVKKRYEEIYLVKKYNPEEYPKYENYDAIEVGHTGAIPKDYFGVMGVPITFMDKYNPEQFEIIGMAEDNGKGFSGEIDGHSFWDGKNKHCIVNGKIMFKRLFVRRRV
jgi:hypothetical protein